MYRAVGVVDIVRQDLDLWHLSWQQPRCYSRNL